MLQLVFFFFFLGPCLPGRHLLSEQPLQIFCYSVCLACALFIAYSLNCPLKKELLLSLWACLLCIIPEYRLFSMNLQAAWQDERIETVRWKSIC